MRAAALLLLAAGCGEPQVPGPCLVLDPPRHDFGALCLGESRRLTCTLHNAGDQDLEILDTRASCGCVLLELSGRRVAPGGTAELAVEFHADRPQAAAEKLVTVFSNDPRQPEARLVLLAQVASVYALEPELVDLGEVEQGISASARVTVTAPPEVRLVEVPPVRRLEVRGQELGAGRFEVTVATSPEVRPGAYFEEAEVRTDHPREPSVRIPVKFSVVPALELESERVDFGDVAAAAGAERWLEVRRRSPDRQVLVEDVTVVLGAAEGEDATLPVRAELEAAQHGVQRLHVEVRPGAPTGPLVGRVDLRTGGDAPYVYTIVLSGNVVAR